MSAATEPQPGYPCFEARQGGCTCAWLREFAAPGDDSHALEWTETVMWWDPECPVKHEESEIDET